MSGDNGEKFTPAADDKVIALLDSLRTAYLAGKISALGFASVSRDGIAQGPQGWAGSDGIDYGGALGYGLHLVSMRYDAVILTAGADASMLSEIDANAAPDHVREAVAAAGRPHAGLSPIE